MNHHTFAQDILLWIANNPVTFKKIKDECHQKCIENTHYVFKEEIECEVLKEMMFTVNSITTL